MAKDKPSFIMYCEWHELFEKLEDEQAGKLIKHIFQYVNDWNPEPPDVLTDIAFTPIKQQFKRDLKKYEKVAERNRLNGSKGGRPSNQETQKTQWVISETQTNPENPIKDKGKGIKDKGEMIKVKGKELEERKADFKKEIFPLLSDSFDREEGKAFFEYWSEHGKNDRKMRFEKEKSFSLQRRVNTWMKRKKEFAQEKKKDGKLSIKEYREQFFQTQSQNLIG